MSKQQRFWRDHSERDRQLAGVDDARPQFNRLRRETPEELSMLTDLASLNVECNDLSGNPTLVLASILLKTLVLSRNELQVDISDWHDLYPRLTHLALVNNPRGQAFPDELVGLRKLEVLDLSYNDLTGEISNDIGDLAFIADLDLSHNQLKGEMPDRLPQMDKTRRLDLSDNMLEGDIPGTFAAMRQLLRLDLWGNELIGCIPSELQELPNLEIFIEGLGFCE